MIYHNLLRDFFHLLYIMENGDQKYLKLLGKNIARIRRSKGFSQLDVCAVISMEKSNLSSIENGRQNPTTLTLKKIADAIEVDVREFFSFEIKSLAK